MQNKNKPRQTVDTIPVEGGGYVRAYRLDGKLHREDGPAVESSKGNKLWYRHGKLHREDGPAIEHTQEWYIDGNVLSKQQVTLLQKKRKEQRRKAFNVFTQGLTRDLPYKKSPFKLRN